MARYTYMRFYYFSPSIIPTLSDEGQDASYDEASFRSIEKDCPMWRFAGSLSLFLSIFLLKSNICYAIKIKLEATVAVFLRQVDPDFSGLNSND